MYKRQNLVYQRKRSGSRAPRGSTAIKLEELAKIRYSFLYEPTLALSSPRDLWTSSENKGVYEKSFGLHGTLQPTWTNEAFDELLLSIAVFQDLEKRMNLYKERHELGSFGRLKFHALCMAGLYFRSEKCHMKVNDVLGLSLIHI